MNDIPMLSDAPAAQRAREGDAVQDLVGIREFGQAPSLEVSRRPPRRVIAAIIAPVCVAASSISTYVFTNPEIPRIDPVVEFPWLVPSGPYFAVVWLTLTLSMAASFYLILRTAPDSRWRREAIAAFVAQLALHTAWAWLLFARRSPIAGLCIVILFVAAVVATIWLAARIDKRASFLLAPYLAWSVFALMLTARIATGAHA